ncbi:dihydrofolate reductase family protein [Microbacterium sp. YY-01]|uniref:dihydrofolate reductase family protein n=1 Tax=Microbacterium sp. YY-01 TaxID=3421634 RepID=UPI003D17343C
MTSVIDRLWPNPQGDLSDAELLETMRAPADEFRLSMNFISSVDGAVTRAGKSGPLGDAADKRIFDLLRYAAHAVLVGAGTVRIEGYGAMRLDEAAVQWREKAGLAQHPVFVLVSARLDLDPSSPVFTDAPTQTPGESRPIIYTVASAPRDRWEALAQVANVVAVGDTAVDPQRIRADLAIRGLTHVHAEGGPHLFGSFLAADAVDTLFLTLAPSVEAGLAGRIAVSPAATPHALSLRTVLRADSELLLQYTREQ